VNAAQTGALGAAFLLAVAALLDSVGVGGWKDRTAFVLIILGTAIGFRGTDAAEAFAGTIGRALGALLDAAGADGKDEAPLALAIVATLLVLLCAAMLARDRPVDDDVVAGRYYSRISCSTSRVSRLNPRIWAVGIATGLLAPQADFLLVLGAFVSTVWAALGAFLTSLGSAA